MNPLEPETIVTPPANPSDLGLAGDNLQLSPANLLLDNPETIGVDPSVVNRALDAARDAIEGTAKTKPRRFGDYELLDQLGQGGMGVVYKAKQIKAGGRLVALKIIRPDRLAGASDPYSETLNRFRSEASAAARIEHDNIASVYEVGEIEGQPFFSMRYVEGGSLADRLKERPLDNHAAANYCQQIALGLAAAHAHGVLHRDLKPHNILIDAETDRALLSDFGLAKLSDDDQHLTMSQQVVGTPPYMSPEQATDSSKVQEASDIYGLGAILYHALTGRPPFLAATFHETLRQVCEAEPISPRSLNPSVNRDLETICLKCLEKRSGRRYLSAKEVYAELLRFLKGEPILARPVSWSERGLRWAQRNPIIASLAGTTLAGIALAFVAVIVGYYFTSTALKQSDVTVATAKVMVDDLLTTVSEESLLNKDGMQPVRKEILGKALSALKELDKVKNSQRLPHEIAMTQYRIGVVTFELEGIEKANPYFQESGFLLETLHRRTPGDMRVSLDLAQLHVRWGAALARSGENYGLLAEQHFEQAIYLRSKIVNLEPKNEEHQRLLMSAEMNLALMLQDRGELLQSRRKLEAIQDRRRSFVAAGGPARNQWLRDLGRGYLGLVDIDVLEQRFPEAREHVNSALENFQSLVSTTTGQENAEDRYQLALCLQHSGALYESQQEVLKALDDWTSAEAYFRELAFYNFTVVKYRHSLAQTEVSLAGIASQQQNFAKALDLLVQATADLCQLSTVDPTCRDDWMHSLYLLLQLKQQVKAPSQLQRIEDQWKSAELILTEEERADLLRQAAEVADPAQASQ